MPIADLQIQFRGSREYKKAIKKIIADLEVSTQQFIEDAIDAYLMASSRQTISHLNRELSPPKDPSVFLLTTVDAANGGRYHDAINGEGEDGKKQSHIEKLNEISVGAKPEQQPRPRAAKKSHRGRE